MIDLYYWPTPNGWKIAIMLEECGIPYRIVPVNIGRGDQMASDFLKISPNNKIPAIVDPDGPAGLCWRNFGGAGRGIVLRGTICSFHARNQRSLDQQPDRA